MLTFAPLEAELRPAAKSARTTAIHFFWNLALRLSVPYRAADLVRSALVISPHFDDETLGCGGTILQKTQAGARVSVAFMTDGRNSHKHLLTPEALREIRTAEGRAACQVLGVKAEDVFLLDIAETQLNQHEAHTTEQLTELLQRTQPEEVFVPYRGEPLLWSEDHLITTRVALAALRRYARPVTLYEYPIWFYRHWPWVAVPVRGQRQRLQWYGASLLNILRLFTNLRCAHQIEAVLELKLIALKEHRSQMTRLQPEAKWAVLGDVCGGDFLRIFFQPHEFFRRMEVR